jgi:two-component system response regulator NreC
LIRIFLADDHKLLRDGVKRIIEEDPKFSVIGETGDGLEITRQIRKLKPDIIILDISLPNLRGIEAIRKIRRFDKKIKILILTMHKNDEYVYQCLVNGAQGYVLKEDADIELISALKTIMVNRIFISPSFTSDVIKKLLSRARDRKTRERGTAFDDLTPRERDIVKLIAEGNANKNIAKKLSISVRTVEHHRFNITKKLGLSNTAALVKYAIKAGLVDLG